MLIDVSLSCTRSYNNFFHKTFPKLSILVSGGSSLYLCGYFMVAESRR